MIFQNPRYHFSVWNSSRSILDESESTTAKIRVKELNLADCENTPPIEATLIKFDSEESMIYLDTDSVFVKRGNADLNDFLSLGHKIEKETGFGISLAHHYRCLVLLPQEADPEIEAARRFYGKLTDGRVYYRGIELRRHDCLVFLKRFQQNLLDILLEAETAREMAFLGKMTWRP